MKTTLSYLLLGLALPQGAFAYSLSHEYFNRNRSDFYHNVYVSQSVQYGVSTASLNLKEDANRERSKFAGHELQTSIGMEHARFIQTGLFYTSVSEAGVQSSSNELRAHEMGAEARFVLTSPVANILAGGGYFFSRTNYISGLDRANLNGEGYHFVGNLTYQFSSNLELNLEVKRVYQDLHETSGTSFVDYISLNSTRAGLGFTVWL